MKLSNRALAGTLVLAALVAAGCPAPNANLPGVGNNNDGNTQASPSPSTSATASPTASPATGDSAEGEPNNDFDTAKALTLGQSLSATFTTDDTDTYRVTIPGTAQDGMLKVTITENDNDMSPNVTFFNNGKTELTYKSASDNTSTPFVSELNVSAGQNYFLKVAANDAGAYTIKVEFTPVADTFERNDDFDAAKALTSGTPVDLYVFAGRDTENGDDRDFFTVTVPEGATSIKIAIDNNSESGDEAQTHNVTLYNSAKAELGYASADNNQADMSHTFEVESAGTYYLAFSANAIARKASRLTVTVE